MTAAETPQRPAGMRRLLTILPAPVRVRLVVAALISAVLALLETVAILTVLPLVTIATGGPIEEGAIGVLHELLGSPGRGTFGLVLVVAVVVLFVLKDLAAMAFTWWQTGFVAEQKVRTSTLIFRHVLSEPLTAFRRRSTAESLRTITTAVAQVFGSVTALMTVVSTGLSILAILAALLVTTPLQALLALVYFGIAALAYLRLVRPRISRVGVDLLEGSTRSTLAALQGLNGFKEVALRQSAEYFVERFREGSARTEQAGRMGNFLSSITRYLLEILFILGVGVLLATSFLSNSPSQGVGSLALFVAAGFRLLPNIAGMVGAVNTYRSGSPAIDLVAAEVRAAAETGPAAAAPGSAVLPFTRELEIEDVRFAYPDASTEVLRGVSLHVPFGSSIAFVGSSGAGKTTLVDLVLGLLAPQRGRVLVDGVDTATDVRAWQRNCAMVAQDVFIAEDSIRKNVLFDIAPEHADPDRLDRAIARAQLDDVVRALPGGLDGDVGDWGSRLSGGQRQRIGIARALYHEPSLLVLDEATSALDNETERRITETIGALAGRTTVVIVAHRLSTVKHVDRIVYLEHGEVAGTGTFDELRASSPGFAHLVALGDLGSGTAPGDGEETEGADRDRYPLS